MNVRVDLTRLTRAARGFLRVVGDCLASHTKVSQAARAIAGISAEFQEKSSEVGEASVRRQLRGRRFVITTLEEADALQSILDVAVDRLGEFARDGQMLAVEREIHRFSRSLHLANTLDHRADVA